MPKIQVLDQATIDKIAAGEVVEKPHSVVKELVENSIDAGASAITIEIKDGGTSLIRITDNGCGIDKNQIELAFLRHSTSKIRKVEDLYTISSLGFRGEALSSISAVAQVELITKTNDSFVGSRYEIHGGKQIAFEEIGAPGGTTIIVRNLFYNTPARKKFLKTATTEGNYIQSLVEKLALSHPEISFKFINNNQIKLQTSGNCNLKDIIYQIYGKDVASNLIEISFESDEAVIKGVIGKPVISRGNRQYENYFINGRYVKSNLLARAIETAYKNFMMQHKYPFTVLNATFDGKYVDVNVHPTKMELRFSEEEKVFQLFYHVIFDGLKNRELITKASLDVKKNTPMTKNVTEKKSVPVKSAEPFEANRIRLENQLKVSKPQKQNLEPDKNDNYITIEKKDKKPDLAQNVQKSEVKPLLHKENENKIISSAAPEIKTINDDRKEIITIPNAKEKPVVSNKNKDMQTLSSQAELLREDNNYHASTKPKQMSMFEEKMVEKSIRDEITIVGQVFDTYWILEYDENMYMIDQHAAHEKVLYERMMKQLNTKTFTSQLLNPPLVITVSAIEEQLLNKFKGQFEEVGFEIEPFGGKEYAIRSIPGNLYGLNEKEIFLEMLDDLSNNLSKTTPDMILDKIASMSCKAAVKGNMKLSYSEAKELLLELMELDNPYHCPHGRPVIVSISKREMEKKFKRIV